MSLWRQAGIGLLSCWATIAAAHEFWMLPKAFVLPPGSATELSLAVGENFVGEPVAFSPALVAALRQYAAGQSADLRARVPARAPAPALALPLQQPGTHLVAFDTHPSQVVLAADKFHAYLHEEGLDFVIRQREAAGTAARPARERFRRNVKTLLQVGDKPDDTFAVRTGQRLELAPLANPYSLAPGDDLGFQVLFDGKPLANALVKAWHRRGAQTVIIRTVTDAQGRVAVTLPWAGSWMLSVVHMVPVTDSKEHDWDSFWGNLTFALPAR